MKTLKLSGFALLLMSLFSCTKSSNSVDQNQLAVRTSNNNSPATKSNIDPGLVINFNPTTGVVGEPVTVTGTFSGTAIPTCGKLQLDQVVNGVATNVAMINVSSSAQTVTYTFTPTVAGNNAYEFYLHYVAGNCDGFGETKSSHYFLNVVEACHGLTLTGKVLKAESTATGSYFFTVQYTVNTCRVRYNHLKTQGGLTAFSTEVINLTDGYEKWEVGNSSHPNTIVKWEESAPLPNNTRTYTVTFLKPWSGTGPVQLTGQWSVHADLNGVDAGTATFDPIYYQ